MRSKTLALAALALLGTAGCDSNEPDGLSGRYEGTLTTAAARQLGVPVTALRGGEEALDAALILDRSTSGTDYDATLELVAEAATGVQLIYRFSAEGEYDDPDFTLTLDNQGDILGLSFQGDVSADEETITLEDENGYVLDVDRVSDDDN